MLVVHWTKQNLTGEVLANGIRPSSRLLPPDFHDYRTNPKGVYVYPFSRNKTQVGIWRSQLKTWGEKPANFNGFVFRLVPEDCPLIVGYWFINRNRPRESVVTSLGELTSLYKEFFTGEIVNSEYNWTDFEIIVPRRIGPKRILRILKDREPKKRQRDHADDDTDA